jgi:hypothetical protein
MAGVVGVAAYTPVDQRLTSIEGFHGFIEGQGHGQDRSYHAGVENACMDDICMGVESASFILVCITLDYFK